MISLVPLALLAQPADQSMLPAIIAALVISIMGATLSIFVVLKRLAFIGQGISHAAFGGVGVALIFGVHATTTMGAFGQLAIVVVFSILAAIWIAALTKTHKGRADTAIGVVLSASMALGFILFTIAESSHTDSDPGHHDELEEILFGSIRNTDPTRAAITVVVALAIIALTWLIRRRLIFWSFDEPVCDAFGLNTNRITNLFFVILALAVVMAMQIAGVVLAAAMLVLPGAGALNLSTKLRPAFIYSITIALVGASAGLLIGYNANYPIGPTIVLAQSALYLATLASKSFSTRLRS